MYCSIADEATSVVGIIPSVTETHAMRVMFRQVEPTVVVKDNAAVVAYENRSKRKHGHRSISY